MTKKATYTVQIDEGDGYPVLYERLCADYGAFAGSGPVTMRGDWTFSTLAEARACARRQTAWRQPGATTVVLSTTGRVVGQYPHV